MDRALREATVCQWTGHCRGYSVSVDIALSNILYVRGQRIVEANVCPWTEHCRGYCVSVDRAL